MDLLDIRKKAREKKEAEAARAKAEAEGKEPQAQDESAAGEPAPTVEAGPAAEPPKTKKKPAKKPRPKKKAVEEREAAPEEAEPLPEPPGESGLVIDDLPDETLYEPEHEEQEPAKPEPKEPVAPAKASAPPKPAEEVHEASGGEGGGEGPSGPSDSEEEPGEGETDAGLADDDIVEYLAFRLADEEYAVKVADVKEIIRLQKTTMVPRAHDFVEGIISLRGVIIPVFDIKKRLGFAMTERSRSNRIVILSENGNPQGIIVDRVTGVARLRKSGIEPPPSVICGVEAEYIEGLGRVDGRLLILFDTDTILSMEGQTAE